jgi:hypothetical protein
MQDFKGAEQVGAAGRQGCLFTEAAAAPAAAAMIESEKSDAGPVQRIGQGKLFRGIAGTEKAVGADDKRGPVRRRTVEPAGKLQPVRRKHNRLPH